MTRQPRAPRRRAVWLVLLAVLAVTLFSVLVPLQAVSYGTPLPFAMLAGAGVSAAPLIAAAYPRSAILVFCPSAFILALAVSADRDQAWPWPWSVPATIALSVLVVVVTVVRGWRTGLVPWAVSNLASLVVLLILPDAVSVAAATANLITTASISAAALLVGVLLAGRIRVGEELTKSLELAAVEQSRRMLVEERTRIARELHDVVAHSMSVIQVQASTARYRIGGLAPDAAAEFDDIAATARGSLAEMRRLLGVLRTDDHEQELVPQQGIGDIPALVESVRRAGVEVGLSLDPPPGDAPPSAQITAFRIVQEALSNAVRHAPGSAVQVELGRRDGALQIRVHNGAGASPGAATAPSDGGHGLLGMQERVALLAGTLMTGPDPAGGWTVTAVLPWAGAGEDRT